MIVALPSASHAAILRIVDHCRQGQVSFKLVPDLYEMSLSRVDVDTVSGIPLIGLKDVSIVGWNALTKRAHRRPASRRWRWWCSRRCWP